MNLLSLLGYHYHLAVRECGRVRRGRGSSWRGGAPFKAYGPTAEEFKQEAIDMSMGGVAESGAPCSQMMRIPLFGAVEWNG